MHPIESEHMRQRRDLGKKKGWDAKLEGAMESIAKLNFLQARRKMLTIGYRCTAPRKVPTYVCLLTNADTDDLSTISSGNNLSLANGVVVRRNRRYSDVPRDIETVWKPHKPVCGK
jgi:hypothetical protein